jgi:hypothetical protein
MAEVCRRYIRNPECVNAEYEVWLKCVGDTFIIQCVSAEYEVGLKSVGDKFIIQFVSAEYEAWLMSMIHS